jgi:DNA-binding LacI/PurR family transcriptional regulator
LSRRSTGVIGFHNGFGYVNARNTFLSEILGGLHEGCEQHGKDLLLHGLYKERSAEAIYQELSNGKIDGLVLLTPPDTELVQILASSRLPAVAVADRVPTLASVLIDDAQGAKMQAQHLYERGHRHILYRRALWSEASIDVRFQAFAEAAQQLGMKVTEGFARDRMHVLSDDEERLLHDSSSQRPTAAVCWVDGAAFELLSYCAKQGIRVPDNLAVVGFNGIEVEGVDPSYLTTIRAPWALVAQTAVKLLVTLIGGTEVSPETILPVELIAGQTT